MDAASGSGLLERMVRAARLESRVYEEVEHDSTATPQAALVVVVGAVSAGIGATVTLGATGIVIGTLLSVLGWALYAYITYLIGSRLLGGQADWGEVARALGFANTPRVLLFFGIVPLIGPLIGLIVAVWVLVATVVALREALDVSLGGAIVTAVSGWLAQALLIGVMLAALT